MFYLRIKLNLNDYTAGGNYNEKGGMMKIGRAYE
jgi:hypothetical protein